MASGAVSSGTTKLISNVNQKDKKLSDGFIGSIIVGGLSGGAATYCG